MARTQAEAMEQALMHWGAGEVAKSSLAQIRRWSSLRASIRQATQSFAQSPFVEIRRAENDRRAGATTVRIDLRGAGLLFYRRGLEPRRRVPGSDSPWHEVFRAWLRDSMRLPFCIKACWSERTQFVDLHSSVTQWSVLAVNLFGYSRFEVEFATPGTAWIGEQVRARALVVSSRVGRLSVRTLLSAPRWLMVGARIARGGDSQSRPGRSSLPSELMGETSRLSTIKVRLPRIQGLAIPRVSK